MGATRREAADQAAGLARRAFLLKAATATAVVWAVPTMITVEPAAAASITSPPPGHEEAATITDPQVVTAEVGVSAAQLPKTGTEPDDLLRAGLAATAGGAALHYWSARTRPPAAPKVEPAD